MEGEQKEMDVDEFHASVVLKEMMPDEKLIFARLEDPLPRMITMSKALLGVVIVIMIFEIYVKHHPPPSFGNVVLFLITWLGFMLLFKKVYICVDAISTKRFLRVRPGISLHYGWLKDVDRVNVTRSSQDSGDLEIILKESGKYEARNLKKPELKPRVTHGVKRFVIANVSSAPRLKATIDSLLSTK
ncbi:MAG: hypothetical protein C0507_25715 [Cyanobacteria bacterium PR.3.49]|nr:hypothetical protein [Cyanobacteria bacterium PR.3.49]